MLADRDFFRWLGRTMRPMFARAPSAELPGPAGTYVWPQIRRGRAPQIAVFVGSVLRLDLSRDSHKADVNVILRDAWSDLLRVGLLEQEQIHKNFMDLQMRQMSFLGKV